MGNKKCQWKELLGLWRTWTFFTLLPKFVLQPGKRRQTKSKGLSSVPRRYQRPLCPRTGTLRGSEDQLGLYISSKVEGVEVKFLVDAGLNITILSPAVREVSVQWQGNSRIGSRRQVGFAVAVDCRQRAGGELGYGFYAPVQLSHHCRYWRPARSKNCSSPS